MKKLFLTCLLLPAMSMAASLAKTEALMEAVQIDRMLDIQQQTAHEQLGDVMGQAMPLDALSAEDKEWFGDLYTNLLTDLFAKINPVIREGFVEFHQNHFTDEELDEIIAWYNTEEGKKYASLSLEFTAEINKKVSEAMMAEMPSLMQNVMTQVQKRFAN